MRKQKCNCACAHANRQSNTPSKRWNADFSRKIHRNRRDPLFIDFLERTGVERGIQDAFLQDSEISGASWEVEQVQDFFREAGAIPDAKIWIDIRVKNKAGGRCRSMWLASDQLAEIMAQQVCLFQPLMGVSCLESQRAEDFSSLLKIRRLR